VRAQRASPGCWRARCHGADRGGRDPRRISRPLTAATTRGHGSGGGAG
jgi:hypothetical protein